ncbi:MAG: hypothetical protein KGY38_05900 [Desulfobacterales bacterium]|nr:hypothetical protein [Desulfobacterales bacterium]
MEEHGFLEQIQESVLGFVRNEIFDPSAGIETDTHLIEAGLDSFSLLKILVFVEKTFDLRIPESEISEERMCSVGNISALIHELLEKK